MIDVVEDHRPPFRCDAACETTADRDAHALLHLLLDPDRCPRDELVCLLVEQQDGARIDVEDLAGAEKERRQQSVKLEMRERRIRERLEPSQTIGIRECPPASADCDRKASPPSRGWSNPACAYSASGGADLAGLCAAGSGDQERHAANRPKVGDDPMLNSLVSSSALR